MLIDFKIRALFIWTDPYLPDLIKILQRAASLRCKYYAPISSEVSKEMKYKKDISHISPLDSHLFFETLSQVILISNNVFFQLVDDIYIATM